MYILTRTVSSDDAQSSFHNDLETKPPAYFRENLAHHDGADSNLLQERGSVRRSAGVPMTRWAPALVNGANSMTNQ